MYFHCHSWCIAYAKFHIHLLLKKTAIKSHCMGLRKMSFENVGSDFPFPHATEAHTSVHENEAKTVACLQAAFYQFC